MNNPLEHIEFERINNEYVYGMYGDFKVIMMKKNGYELIQSVLTD